VAGVRNFAKISRQRRVLWILLAISSIPIHLLFNSAVFKTLDANEYDYVIVREDFLEGAPMLSYDPYPNTSLYSNKTRMEEQRKKVRDRLESMRQRYLENTSPYDRLSPQECVSQYSGAFVSGRSNVFLVTGNDSVDLNVFASDRVRFSMPDGNLGPFFSSGADTW